MSLLEYIKCVWGWKSCHYRCDVSVTFRHVSSYLCYVVTLGCVIVLSDQGLWWLWWWCASLHCSRLTRGFYGFYLLDGALSPLTSISFSLSPLTSRSFWNLDGFPYLFKGCSLSCFTFQTFFNFFLSINPSSFIFRCFSHSAPSSFSSHVGGFLLFMRFLVVLPDLQGLWALCLNT